MSQLRWLPSQTFPAFVLKVGQSGTTDLAIVPWQAKDLGAGMHEAKAHRFFNIFCGAGSRRLARPTRCLR